MCLCVCVCHTLILCRNGCTDRADFFRLRSKAHIFCLHLQNAWTNIHDFCQTPPFYSEHICLFHIKCIIQSDVTWRKLITRISLTTKNEWGVQDNMFSRTTVCRTNCWTKSTAAMKNVLLLSKSCTAGQYYFFTFRCFKCVISPLSHIPTAFFTRATMLARYMLRPGVCLCVCLVTTQCSSAVIVLPAEFDRRLSTVCHSERLLLCMTRWSWRRASWRSACSGWSLFACIMTN